VRGQLIGVLRDTADQVWALPVLARYALFSWVVFLHCGTIDFVGYMAAGSWPGMTLLAAVVNFVVGLNLLRGHKGIYTVEKCSGDQRGS
jgi:hypothetical protein